MRRGCDGFGNRSRRNPVPTSACATSGTNRPPLAGRLDALLDSAPYELAVSPVTVFDLAAAQVTSFAPKQYCRSLDRLHLATMEALRLRRLLTNDTAQAKAAEGMGFVVIRPR